MFFLVAYLGWAAFSSLYCQFEDVGFAFVIEKSKIVIPCIAGLTMINTRRDLYLLAWTITATMGYVAYELNLSYFGGFNRLEVAGFGGMDNNSITIAFVTGVGFAFFLGLNDGNIFSGLVKGISDFGFLGIGVQFRIGL